ncbi:MULTISPECIES: ABC transporter ATP-binding protein [Peptoniphilus]|uniref:ABC transporter ATP-binding protein n=1 Tax=Peptoniphilus TaxID=162289 RepID=UPI00028A18D3|nr:MULTISPECIES: ABC transporter ATP-binding protein [Peptoniphilus]MDU1042828.1 ABC transporter ATP-binding protein [Peptoniphilus rhinitidis]MDU2115001.1 ABC transporter ATP-binding protein [Peptoniphilus lacydonensis]MDU5595414.1 ABC transporter ATP-binding protein [Peptoniphilus rhinitidis]MDU7302663.1 ABC transporter ATP-binding protein [Peptoniphilus lacydonensis]
MKNKNLIKKVMPYFYKYKLTLFLDLFCAAFTTASEMILPLILRALTNRGMKDLESITFDFVLKLSLIYISIKIVEIIAQYFMTSIGHIMGARIETDMRRDLYSHLQTLSDTFYNETKVGVIMSRITNDLFDITEFAHHCPEEYFIGAIKILVSLIILLNINVKMTLLIYIMIPLMIFFSGRFRKKMREAQKDQRVHIGHLNSSIEDSLLGIKVVKSFANEDVENEKFMNENDKFLNIKKRYYKSMAGFNTINRVFDGLMYLILIASGGYFLMKREIGPEDLIVYVMYVQSLLATVRRIIEFTEQFQKGMTGIERFAEIMSVESDIKDRKNAKEIKNVRGEISFKNVYFSYGEGGEKVLENFSVDITPGEKLAIVGPSGAGKTTICNLIPRFYDVDSGSVNVDGIDVRDIKIKSLRENIGIVQQDVYLFSGTVKDNIGYGKSDASDGEIIEAAKLAGAYEFIKNLPDGFDTYVGERGVKLSGGQKQRISIARVFLKNPPILILDEATSALDNKSEIIVQDSIEKLSKGRTTITIAHRLTTVQNADLIIVMTKDGIIERGSHKELMDRKDYYYNLYTKGGRLE